MASKITKLILPQYHLHIGANYTHFLKIVFELNYQRKDLMDKEVLDARWIQMANNQIKDKGVRANLISLINKKDAREVWKNKYTPKESLIRSGPRVENTKPVPIDGRLTNVPIISKFVLDRMDYVHFASVQLPRANQGRMYDRKTTDKAWLYHVQYLFDNRTRSKHGTTASSLSAQSRSRAADKYWANREAEEEADGHEDLDRS